MSDEVSICAGCDEPRSVEEFPVPGRRCIYCRRATVRRHYRTNRSYYLVKARARQRRVIAETRLWLTADLSEHPCVDCGIADIRVLEFDHRDPSTKVLAAAVLARSGYPLKRVVAEVGQCDVRCANCHRIRTHAQRGWWAANSLSRTWRVRPEGFEPPNLLIRRSARAIFRDYPILAVRSR